MPLCSDVFSIPFSLGSREVKKLALSGNHFLLRWDVRIWAKGKKED